MGLIKPLGVYDALKQGALLTTQERSFIKLLSKGLCEALRGFTKQPSKYFMKPLIRKAIQSL